MTGVRTQCLQQAIVSVILLFANATPSAFGAALELEAKIPLGDIRGRIDHLAVDPGRQRLYVAELGNDTVGVVDIKEGKTIRTLTGFHEPQGIAYEPSTDTVYVANGDDGSVRAFKGANLDPLPPIALGDDADNVRIDPDTHYVWVGYGRGALAAIDPTSTKKVADIPIKGHPESFQLDPDGSRIFVNVPDAGEIAVVDRKMGKQIEGWKAAPLNANYPLILDSPETVLAVFRHPAHIGVFRKADGRQVQNIETCGDSDDVFADAKRARIYVTCGAGFIETFVRERASYRPAGQVTTAKGARTSLFVPALDRLYLAVRGQRAAPAAIWVMKPTD